MGHPFSLSAALACLYSTARAEIPLVGHAVFHQEIIAADPQGHAGRVQLAIADDHIVVIVASHCIVAGVDVTIFNQHIVAGADINAVFTAMDGDIPKSDIFALEQRVTPVTAV